MLAWRRHRKLSQSQLADISGVLRPYLSRLERNEVDPSLSLVYRLAAALELSPGQLIDEDPPQPALDRHALDDLAREFLRRDRRRRSGDHALRRIRVRLGEEQWKAFLKRIEKQGAYEN